MERALAAEAQLEGEPLVVQAAQVKKRLIAKGKRLERKHTVSPGEHDESFGHEEGALVSSLETAFFHHGWQKTLFVARIR